MKSWWSSAGRLRWVLLASLCLNVALASYVTVQWAEPAPWPPAGAMMPLRLTERVAARLPKADADILWQVYRGKEPEIRALQADYLAALLVTMRQVGQNDLDKPALRAAVEDARSKRVKIGEQLTEVFLDTMEKISAKGRRQLVGGFPR